MFLKLFLVALDDGCPFCTVKGYALLVHPTVLVVEDSRVISAHYFKGGVLITSRLTVVEIMHRNKMK